MIGVSSTQIKEAYAESKNIYDDTLTQTKWWAKLYIAFFWGGVDDQAVARRVLDAIPDNFSGNLLDVPVGTGVFTAPTYAQLP
ncbi:MAG TPA: SAM-dependent methyltransferase, partial [Clostridiaceae bacterium]|nr:SAM-dependent methyltransferase [Clostridiaceae bacterium]